MEHQNRMTDKKTFCNLATTTIAITILFICSQITIPAKPIPFTMQTFAVMLISLAFRRWQAITAVIIYLIIGALGLPVFANFNYGIKVLTGLSGGYLWGFLLATIIMSGLKKHMNDNIFLLIVNCLIGTALICACGVFRLSLSIGLSQALNLGLYPFMVSAIYKIALAVICITILQHLSLTRLTSQNKHI